MSTKAKDLPSLQYLNEWLIYSPDTGELWWKKRPSNNVSLPKLAGSWATNGYRQVKMRGRWYLAHRLIWLMHYGVSPMYEIDHINRNRADNRITNLRDVLPQVNSVNSNVRCTNQLGVKGVTYNARYTDRPYRLYIRRLGKEAHRSYHATLEEATTAANEFYSNE